MDIEPTKDSELGRRLPWSPPSVETLAVAKTEAGPTPGSEDNIIANRS